MKLLTVLTAVATLVGAGGVTPSSASTPTPTPMPPVHVLSVPSDLDATAAGPDGIPLAGGPPAADTLPAASARPCAAKVAVPVRDGAPMLVQLPPAKPFPVGSPTAATWADPPVKDPTWRLYFYSLRWVCPLMRSAIEGKQPASREALVAQVLRFYVDNPDRGKPVLGWDEGASLRRLESLNCLYRMTGDARLRPLMAAEVGVQFGPRYYGPPFHAVHNHGLMANLRVVEAGRLIGRADWAQRAGARIRSEAGLAFSPRGTSYEQSSSYQAVNAQLWGAAAATLAELEPTDPVVAAIRATVSRAWNVVEWLTEPDGRFVQIGDAPAQAGRRAPDRRGGGVFRDDVAGLLVGRWSFADPATSYYTLRYGPPRRAHGHHDKGGVTWSTGGTRVLVGSGYHGYGDSDPFVAYQRTPESSNVAVPAGAKLNTRAGATLVRSVLRSTRHRWWVTDSVHGRAHARAVDVDHSARSLVVADTFAGKGAADQLWHLDPAWQAVSTPRAGAVLRFRHRDGRTLKVTTNGTLAAATRGALRPVSGWNFPAPQQRVANWQLRIRGTSGAVRTTFDVD